jgi:hypothetical protein
MPRESLWPSAAVIAGWALAACGLAALPARADSPAFPPEQLKFFEEKVRPVLANRCYECHGAKKQESGLRLDSRAGVLQGGDAGAPAADPGKPDESVLIAAVRRTGDYEMPPAAKLPDEEIDALVTWVEMGLPWPADGAPGVKPLEEQMREVRQSHWSLQAIRRPPLPPTSETWVRNADWPAGPIDFYVLAKLEAAGLHPSPPADRRTLLRRVTFDLTGLPPTPDETEAFLADLSPEAYERVVERLLASPHYGQRWGRHWLDVARYGDTRGYAFAQERRYPYAYTYRDYVIDSFNADLPYDRFVLEQLAADLLPSEEGNRPLAAMGFLTCGRKFNNRHDDIDDQIDVVARGLLGLTVACARCHDHKYDPIPTEDYYSLYGVFASSREPDELPLLGDPSQAAGYDAFAQELKAKQKVLDDYNAELLAKARATAREKVTDYLVRVVSDKPESLLSRLPFLSLSGDELRPKLIARWRDYVKARSQADHPVFGPWTVLTKLPEASFSEQGAAAVAGLSEMPAGIEQGEVNPLLRAALQAEPPVEKTDVARLYGKVLSEAYAQWKQAGGDDGAKEKLSPEQRQLAEVLIAEESAATIPAGELRDYVNRAERNRQRELQKQVQSFQASSPNAPPRAMVLAENDSPHNPRVFLRGNQNRPGDSVPRQFLAVLEGDARQPFSRGSGRLELAREIVADDNPLTARVIVNRIWMHHFGEPIVDSPSDFGVRTEQPVQWDVLDYLAATLKERGWSLKSIHREIVLSSTYRQSSGVAGADRSDAPATPAAVDPENRLLWRMNRKRLEFEPLRDSLLAAAGQLDTEMRGRPVNLIDAPFTRRRTVYGFIDRQDLPNLLRVFDFASPDQSAAGRPLTTVPQQALFLMNSPFVIEQAKALASRGEIASAGGEAEKIAALYRVVFSRPPSEAETRVGLEFIQSASAVQSPLSPWEQYSQLLLLTNEFTYVD